MFPPERLMLRPDQCRGARGLLGWSQQELADRSRLQQTTVAQFETGTTTPRKATVAALLNAFTAAGIGFIAEPDRIGVVLRIDPEPGSDRG